MLVPVIFILAFMAALTGAVLETSSRAAHVAWDTAVARACNVAITDGVADFTHGLATYVGRHGAAGPWPASTSRSTPRSMCGARTSAPCPFTYVISAKITDASRTGAQTSGDSASNLQAAVIDEQRVSAIVTVTVSGQGGTVGTRTRFLTYRVFETAPFAVISGSRDVTTVNGSEAAAQGDSGGSAPTGRLAAGTGPASDAATAPLAAQSADDTRIHVRLTCRTITPRIVPFRNDQQAPGNAGLPWGNAAGAAYETPCSTPDAPVDNFQNEHWTNGDTNPSGWTQ